MTWVRLDDGYPENLKVVGLSDKAFRADIEGWCYCARNLTDGQVPQAVAKRWPRTAIAELVAAHRWHPDPSGYAIHDYLDYNPSRADVEEERSKKQAAGRAGGKASGRARASRSVAPVVEPRTRPVPEPVPKEPTSSSPFHEDAVRLTRRLVAALRGREVKVPGNLRSWETAAERLLRIDERPVAEVVTVLDFSQADPFWSVNVLSMPTFRAKYDQLRLRMQAPNSNGRHEETTAERLERLGLT